MSSTILRMLRGSVRRAARARGSIEMVVTVAAGTIFAIPLVPLAVRGNDCIDYGEYTHWVGKIEGLGGPLATDGSRLCAMGDGLELIEVSDPASPRLLGRVALSVYPTSLAMTASHVYATEGEAGIEIVDISNPESPAIAGALDTPGEAWAIAVAEDYAYVADGSAGLQVVDVSQPNGPIIVASLDTPGGARDVASAGAHVLVASGQSGLQMVDVSDPHQPMIVGTLAQDAGCVAVAGDLAYVTIDNGTVLGIVDVSDPTAPLLIGSVPSGYYFRSRPTVTGNVVLVAQDEAGVIVVDVTDPTSPIAGSVQAGEAGGVVSIDDHAFVSLDVGLLVALYVSDPPIPAVAALPDPGDPVEGVVVVGDRAFLAAESHLFVVDIANPGSPEVIASLEVSGEPTGIQVVSEYAYLVGTELEVVDVSEPTAPVLVGSAEIPAGARAVDVEGGYAYAVGWVSGLHVLDVSNPVSPAIVTRLELPSGAFGWDVAVRGGYAYIAAGELLVIDSSEPSSPNIIASVPAAATGVTVAGDHAYLAGSSSTPLSVVDISEPTEPALVGDLNTGSFSMECVAVSGGIAYLGGTSSGLHVADISDPTNPTYVGGVNPITTLGWIPSVAVSGNRVYAVFFYHFYVLPTQCPSTTEVSAAVLPATPLALHQNVPNPFNPNTSIVFELPVLTHASLRIFDAAGRVVRTLADGELPPDLYRIPWDGRDAHGRELVSGVYFYRLETADQSLARKLVMVR